jgi:NADP-dependent 3-hydroxy acid dehydrogenase YdfG
MRRFHGGQRRNDERVPRTWGTESAVTGASSILITGASSGIGSALARAYSEPGTTLALGGRDQRRLDEVAAQCRGLGAAVAVRVVDVTDAQAMAGWVGEADAARPLDLVVANAGIGDGLDEDPERFAATRRIIEVNLTGALNTIEPALARMLPRRHGQIALMSSIAALRGIPGAQGYCASKAALKALAEGLRAPLAAEGILVSLVMPGFVRTSMNEGRGFPTPLRLEPDRAARLIRRGLDRERFLISFPRPLVWGSRLLNLWPPLADALALRAARRSRR